ncbi:ABC transporter substrate-binding protein [Fusobacterium sp. MFO224]|uniref:ABC transporter substrate-binding protein n=1 Tax=Fusobacterium sp. MFO224 TaxID=3378070 RepID=UPI00385435AC
MNIIKKNIKKIGTVLLGLVILAGCGKEKVAETKKINIGITQIIEHAALDAVAEGFKEALADGGYTEDKVNIEMQNAQGDFGVAQTIASSYVQDKKDLVLAISTPSAQAMYNATKEIPILISAVTSPEAVGLTGDNVTGTSDMAPVDRQVQLIKKLLPESKTIGVVYNTSEENSQILVKQLKLESEKNGYKVIEKGITNINEIGQALDVLLKDVDVLYTPTDNLVVSATPLVLSKANQQNIPVIGCIKDQVVQGALATETLDYKKLGYQTGEMAVRVLNGEKPKDIPIETQKDTKLLINKEAVKRLNIDLPQELKDRAEMM